MSVVREAYRVKREAGAGSRLNQMRGQAKETRAGSGADRFLSPPDPISTARVKGQGADPFRDDACKTPAPNTDTIKAQTSKKTPLGHQAPFPTEEDARASSSLSPEVEGMIRDIHELFFGKSNGGVKKAPPAFVDRLRYQEGIMAAREGSGRLLREYFNEGGQVPR